MDDDAQKKKLNLKISGMHCASCEVLIERKLKKIPGVNKVKVSRAKEEAEILCSDDVELDELQSAVKSDGYSLALKEQGSSSSQLILGDKRKFTEIGAVLILLLAGYLILKQFDLLPSIGITDNMSFAFVFMLGLVAATSTCLAVSGGLLLALSARYNEQHPNLTRSQKFEPHLYFNAGRIVSYTSFGALIGLIGSAFTLSTTITGLITVISSILMIIIGLQLLQIFPWLNHIHLKLPKFIAHRIYDASSDEESKITRRGSFLFGASTFFLPCGFTIALQLYVLGKGDMVTGALTMLAFSLGTLPSLISIGALTSFTRGNFHRHVITLSAVLIIVLGMFNISNGFALTGISFASPVEPTIIQNTTNPANQAEDVVIPVDENVKIIDGKQIVEMKVNGLQYYPHRFTILQGIPVEWVIDGKQAQGCAQVIIAPKLGITEYLSPDKNKVISFIPKETGFIPFSCTMGMTTPGAGFDVVPNTQEIRPDTVQLSPGISEASCNSELADCNVQKLNMEISREKGFYPNTFTVKKGIPVELEINTKMALGGCMSTLVIPEYNVAHLLTLGKTMLKFTPTKEGIVAFTCSMGSKMGKFVVIS